MAVLTNRNFPQVTKGIETPIQMPDFGKMTSGEVSQSS